MITSSFTLQESQQVGKLSSSCAGDAGKDKDVESRPGEGPARSRVLTQQA